MSPSTSPDPSGSAPVRVTLAHIEAAAALLKGIIRDTPLSRSRALTEAVGGPVDLKCENLQRTGSFKIRGAYVRIHGLSEEQRAAGVVAASAGNHAQGVALAAQLLGITATVFMSHRAALPKIAATEGYGARVRLVGDSLEDALAEALTFATETGAHFIHPFDHPDVVAGQGTVGLEIAAQAPDVRTVVIPTGGGGLTAGTAAAIKALKPDVRVVAVQAAHVAAWPESLAAGRPVATRGRPTIADGIAVAQPGAAPFLLINDLVDRVITVSEDSLARALLHCLERAKLVVEPAGAAGVAALLDDPTAFEPPVVCVLSGGNVDPLLMLHVIQHGMAAASRYLSARVRLEDRPGALATLLRRVGELGCNVLDVEHSRISGALAIGEVDVALKMETRGPQHRIDVIDALRASGHQVVLE
ncbi:MAG TPA: threonine ammonia-lyase [Pseudonocardia sp.]|nr:threonine ammonia-lyase [Pseudonocardia sp.]